MHVLTRLTILEVVFLLPSLRWHVCCSTNCVTVLVCFMAGYGSEIGNFSVNGIGSTPERLLHTEEDFVASVEAVLTGANNPLSGIVHSAGELLHTP